MQAAREWGEESAHRIVQLDTQKLERRPERGPQRPAGRVGWGGRNNIQYGQKAGLSACAQYLSTWCVSLQSSWFSRPSLAVGRKSKKNKATRQQLGPGSPTRPLSSHGRTDGARRLVRQTGPAQTYCCVSTKDGPTDKEMEPRDRHDKKHTMRNEGQDLIQLFLDSLFLVAQFCGASPSAALADTVRSNQATQTSTKKKKKKKSFCLFFPFLSSPLAFHLSLEIIQRTRAKGSRRTGRGDTNIFKLN